MRAPVRRKVDIKTVQQRKRGRPAKYKLQGGAVEYNHQRGPSELKKEDMSREYALYRAVWK